MHACVSTSSQMFSAVDCYTRACNVPYHVAKYNRTGPTYCSRASLNTPKIASLRCEYQAALSYKDAPACDLRSGTRAATCVPPTTECLSLGPKVAHLSVPEDSTLLETIAQQLKAPQPVNAQPQRATENVPVNQYAYIRVHLHPKRFPAVYTIDWKRSVVYDSSSFVVVDKPAGVQVIPTVDNVLENVLACTTQALQLLKPLLVTHRLDSCTQGLVVLGKTVAFVQLFNKLLQQSGAIRKFYRTLTQVAPSLGHMQHYIKTGEHTKGQPVHSIVASGPGPGVQHCSLEILQVQPVSLSAAAAAKWGPVAYESLLELHTGRTHQRASCQLAKWYHKAPFWTKTGYLYELNKTKLLQIRVQLAAEGCPLYGDSLYASPTGPAEQQAQFKGKEPTEAIGLQACKMIFRESAQLEHCLEARQPWWREVHKD